MVANRGGAGADRASKIANSAEFISCRWQLKTGMYWFVPRCASGPVRDTIGRGLRVSDTNKRGHRVFFVVPHPLQSYREFLAILCTHRANPGHSTAVRISPQRITNTALLAFAVRPAAAAALVQEYIAVSRVIAEASRRTRAHLARDYATSTLACRRRAACVWLCFKLLTTDCAWEINKAHLRKTRPARRPVRLDGANGRSRSFDYGRQGHGTAAASCSSGSVGRSLGGWTRGKR